MDTLPSYFNGFIVVLLFSAFIKIFTALSIFRMGLGLSSGSFGIIFAALAFVLSVLISEQQVSGLGGYESLLSGNIKATEFDNTFRPFLSANSKPETLESMMKLSKKLASKTQAQATETIAADAQSKTQSLKPSLGVLGASFLVSQLQEALKLGLMFIIPFLVIDLLIANALLVLNVSQVSATLVALPIKLLLFLAIDGWTLVSEKLISGYIS